MIRFANYEDKQFVRQMWENCFNDTEEFIDLYFSEIYKCENTLIYFEENQHAASLQLLPYFFTFYGYEIPVYYVSGACTLLEFRKKGYMGKLLLKTFDVLKQRNISLLLVIPAEKVLFDYYKKFGFETVFKSAAKSQFLKNILNEAVTDFDKAYNRFDKFFRKKDFSIQKSKADFETIVKDAKLTTTPPKLNLSGMARIVNVEFLLSLYAVKNPNKSFSIELNDSILQYNNSTFYINKGNCCQTKMQTPDCLKININDLCSLLFGYDLDNFPNNSVSQYFESHETILNLMLE